MLKGQMHIQKWTYLTIKWGMWWGMTISSKANPKNRHNFRSGILKWCANEDMTVLWVVFYLFLFLVEDDYFSTKQFFVCLHTIIILHYYPVTYNLPNYKAAPPNQNQITQKAMLQTIYNFPLKYKFFPTIALK